MSFSSQPLLTSDSSSHAKLENKLNLLIAEVRAGKREGSIISTKTFDASAQNDRETWDALRRELEDIGISPGVITEKRRFIIAWFQEAVAAGRLEEDAPSDYDDDDGAISLYESDGPAGNSDSDSVPEGEMSSMLIESYTTEGNTVEGSLPKAPRSSRQPSEVVYSRRHPPSSPLPQQRKRNSRVKVSYLLNTLRGSDMQFLYAAIDGDVPKTKELLEKGADIESKDKYGNTALTSAAERGDASVVRLLLEKGADIESKDRYGNTALILTAHEGHEAVVWLLLEKGADINTKDQYGRTALYFAETHRDKTIAWLLRDAGAKVE